MQRYAAFDLLIVPGLWNSGPDHWQSHWCAACPTATRILQDDWNTPQVSDWLKRLQSTIDAGSRPAILVTHSLGTALAAHWAARGKAGRIKAAFLVAPPDVDSPAHTPDCERNFSPLPLSRFPVPATVVASRTDPYADFARARLFGASWGAEFVDVGDLGHINSDCKLGLWPQGLALLDQLVARIA